jgi:hypothetical protein
MVNIFKAFVQIWSYPLSKEEKSINFNQKIGQNEVGVSEFFKSLEIFSKSKKYSFK